MLRMLEDWSRAAWRPDPRAMLVWLEVFLVVVLAVQAARLIWIVAEPRGPLGVPQPLARRASAVTDLSTLQRFDPFFRVAEGASRAADPQTEAGFQLFGVRADGRGGGSAIIGGADGRQGSYLVGEDVAPGVRLQAVAADHAVLSRGGGRVRLEFARPAPGAPIASVLPPLAPATAAASADAALDPKALLAATSLSPRTVDGQPAGYRVSRRGTGEALAQAGLQEGDVLLAVEGAPLDAERLSELPDLLAQSKEVELRIERGGRIVTQKVQMAPR